MPLAAGPPAATRRALDRFRQEYNHVRPHEALGMQTPASVYVPSEREYPRQVAEPEYPETMLVRGGTFQGTISLEEAAGCVLSEVLWGERIGLLPLDDRWYTVYFVQVPLGRFDSWQRRVLPLPAGVGFDMDRARAGEVSPSPAPLPLEAVTEKVSGMCPV